MRKREKREGKRTTIGTNEVDHEGHVAVEKRNDGGIGGIGFVGGGGQDLEEVEDRLGEAVVAVAHEL